VPRQHAKYIELFLHQQGIDTITPSGKAMFGMMGVFAEFERAMIQERVNAGLARARAEGTPFGRPRLDNAIETAIRKALQKGDTGIRKIAVKFGVDTGTVQRIKNELAA
jgi:DNA invertase Pin-like site-specific DNA recombinase